MNVLMCILGQRGGGRGYAMRTGALLLTGTGTVVG